MRPRRLAGVLRWRLRHRAHLFAEKSKKSAVAYIAHLTRDTTAFSLKLAET